MRTGRDAHEQYADRKNLSNVCVTAEFLPPSHVAGSPIRVPEDPHYTTAAAEKTGAPVVPGEPPTLANKKGELNQNAFRLLAHGRSPCRSFLLALHFLRLFKGAFRHRLQPEQRQ